MNVLIADKLSKSAVTALEKMGHQVVSKPDVTEDGLAAEIGAAEVLIVRSKKVNAKAIQAGKNLSLIIRAGAGVNTIDLKAASSIGIHVSNCPGKNTEAVAELAIGLLVAADRRIVDATNDLRNGKWRKKEYGKARGLKDRTLGVIGLGSIGSAVVRRALGMEMKVVAWSRSLTPAKAEELGITYCDSPLKVAELADAVTLHVAAKPETKGMVNQEFLSRMKDRAILINTARGDIVDTAALKEAIKAKKLRVGMDVFDKEPEGGEDAFADTELAGMIIGTPHIGASTDQASEAIAEEVVRIVKTFQETGTPVNTVNIRKKTSAIINLVVRHYNKVGVIAGVLDELRSGGINIEEMENLIFEGGQAACCTLKLDDKPSSDLMARISKVENVISAMLK